jgi:hypothetical protein
MRIVNIIPNSLSGETHQDSEPNLAVNPNNPLQIAVSAFTFDPSGGPFAPIFVSTDGGMTWALKSVVPGASSKTPTGDITLRFGRTSDVLYAAIIRGDNFHMNILRTGDFTSSTPMTVLFSRAPQPLDDQPWVQATTGGQPSTDRVYVGSNNLNNEPRTATIDQSLDAATAPPPAGFFFPSPITIASRVPDGLNGPSIRPVIHRSGRIYAAYFNWTSSSSGGTSNDPFDLETSDVVVCRDDHWGLNFYGALVDAEDGQTGVRVAKQVQIHFDTGKQKTQGSLGQERVGSHLSIAVDPNDRDLVFLAWGDGHPNTLHLRRSTDGGAKWSGDLRAVPRAINPALAINDRGEVGFLFQRLTDSGDTWETHLEISNDRFQTSPAPIVLAAVPSHEPKAQFLPYLGDYIYLTAVRDAFMGVFCANNTPNRAHFPKGVNYLRNADFSTHTLLDIDNKTPVAPSIDPFFFTTEVAPIEPILALLLNDSARTRDITYLVPLLLRDKHPAQDVTYIAPLLL